MKILSITSSQQNFKRGNLHPTDLAYKKSIQKGLKDTFNLSCKIEDLESIAGPVETREIITKLNPSQYVPGDNFRANFHIHTRASDGKLTPKLFLEMCKAWSDKMFYKGKSKDELPPFSAAITDHNEIKSVKETIALISQKPKEYENFRFVAGCEFLIDGYKKPYSAFEAVGLGFNPFDKALEPMTHGFSSKNNIDDIPTILASGGILSWAHPIYCPDKLNEDFFNFLKTNKIEAVEGNYQYIDWDMDYVNEGKKLLDPLMEKFDILKTGGTDSHSSTIFGR
ncbi:MAG: hypothetical protein E7Z89_05760 [Cyanobacteria bacterium SIG28]|nr:hypothetical protein [Cyanobacteria bacterium SIG28]